MTKDGLQCTSGHVWAPYKFQDVLHSSVFAFGICEDRALRSPRGGAVIRAQANMGQGQILLQAWGLQGDMVTRAPYAGLLDFPCVC